MADKKKTTAKTEPRERKYFFTHLGVTVTATSEEEALKLAEAQKKAEEGDGDS